MLNYRKKKLILLATSVLLVGCMGGNDYYEPIGPQYEPLARERRAAPNPVSTHEVATPRATTTVKTDRSEKITRSQEPAMDRPTPASAAAPTPASTPADEMPMIQSGAPDSGPPTM